MDEERIASKDVKHLYSETYFMNEATGHEEFNLFDGKFSSLIDKFQMVVKVLELKKTDSLLDIGCGRGEMVIYHSLCGGDATGVDFSEEAIKLARAKAVELKADCKFIVSSFEEIDEQKRYDIIVSIDFIEHISVNEGKTFYTKCFNLLNPGGKLLIYTFPNTLRRKYGYRLIRLFSLLKKKPLPRLEPDTISDHYRQYHLNEQNYLTIRKSSIDQGFRKTIVIYFDPSVNDSFLKSMLVHTPFRHLFLRGLTLISTK